VARPGAEENDPGDEAGKAGGFAAGTATTSIMGRTPDEVIA
jgi:hypothetical protein